MMSQGCLWRRKAVSSGKWSKNLGKGKSWRPSSRALVGRPHKEQFHGLVNRSSLTLDSCWEIMINHEYSTSLARGLRPPLNSTPTSLVFKPLPTGSRDMVANSLLVILILFGRLSIEVC